MHHLLLAGGLMLVAQVAQDTRANRGPTDTSTLTVYPSVNGLAECTDFSIEVDGRRLWVESLRKSMPEDAPGWFRDPEVEQNLSVNIASFGCSGAHTLTINWTLAKTVTRAAARASVFRWQECRASATNQPIGLASLSCLSCRTSFKLPECRDTALRRPGSASLGLPRYTPDAVRPGYAPTGSPEEFPTG